VFKRILVPTDGSRLSQQTARAAVELVRNLGADVIGLVATTDWRAGNKATATRKRLNIYAATSVKA
jgi:nucleotide-binding universal stress UspA family protein